MRGANNGAKSCIVAAHIVSRRKAVTSSSGSCAFSFPPLTLIRYLSPWTCPSSFAPRLVRVCSDVPASGIEGENSNPDPNGSHSRALSLSLLPSLHIVEGKYARKFHLSNIIHAREGGRAMNLRKPALFPAADSLILISSLTFYFILPIK